MRNAGIATAGVNFASWSQGSVRSTGTKCAWRRGLPNFYHTMGRSAGVQTVRSSRCSLTCGKALLRLSSHGATTSFPRLTRSRRLCRVTTPFDSMPESCDQASDEHRKCRGLASLPGGHLRTSQKLPQLHAHDYIELRPFCRPPSRGPKGANQPEAHDKIGRQSGQTRPASHAPKPSPVRSAA